MGAADVVGLRSVPSRSLETQFLVGSHSTPRTSQGPRASMNPDQDILQSLSAKELVGVGDKFLPKAAGLSMEAGDRGSSEKHTLLQLAETECLAGNEKAANAVLPSARM